MGNLASSKSCACSPCRRDEGGQEVVQVRDDTRFTASSFLSEDSEECSQMRRSSKLVFIETTGSPEPSGGASKSLAPGATGAAAEGGRGVGGGPRATVVSMVRTAGLSLLSSLPDKERRLERFNGSLRDAGILTSGWGSIGAKSVEHLFWEAFQQRGCIVARCFRTGHLKRVTRLVKVKLVAEIHGVYHTLCSRLQLMHNGQIVEKTQGVVRKLTWVHVDDADFHNDSEIYYAEDSPCTESWKQGCKKTLEERVGLSPEWQSRHLIEDLEGYHYVVEDGCVSAGFPGLKTTYCIHEVTLRVRDPSHAGVQVIGLPDGRDFATAEGNFTFNGEYEEQGLAIGGAQLNVWTWVREDCVKTKIATPSTYHEVRASQAAAAAPGGEAEAPCKPCDSVLSVPGRVLDTAMQLRRVPLPPTLGQHLSALQQALRSGFQAPPNAALCAAMARRQTAWARVQRIAKDILSPKYTLEQFNDALRSFPELDLYLYEEPTGDEVRGGTSPTALAVSGRTCGDEYQRTVGAFFAIYWLMRIDLDGKDGFSNGVDEHWRPITDVDGSNVMLPEKRAEFKNRAKWPTFKHLLLDAGLLEEHKTTNLFRSCTTQKVNEKRLVSLLALTAVHDIMKMKTLLPVVQPEHAPYRGYQAGNQIGDHDHALAYIMEHYPDVLPSFRGLDPQERRSLVFTQCDLCFNHGWFVQAEAPPGAMLTRFRETVLRDRRSKVSQRDVALYFVHWLTDLAGAEPTPLSGCEKLVTKFPLPVLNSFLRSFEVVADIVTKTETEVVEAYLKLRWAEADPLPGPLPTGDSAIAKMRLLCMAQANAGLILNGFDELTADDQAMLSVEMSRTGCVCQSFSEDLAPKEAHCQGPAFLVYYGPAFLQSLGNDSAVGRLTMLAEIYRCARELWPASAAQVHVSVTIRIDMVKALSLAAMQAAVGATGDEWLLVRHNELEAFVERRTMKELNRMITSGQLFRILDLSGAIPARAQVTSQLSNGK